MLVENIKVRLLRKVFIADFQQLPILTLKGEVAENKDSLLGFGVKTDFQIPPYAPFRSDLKSA